MFSHPLNGFAPQAIIPLAMLFSGNLSILGCGIEAGVTQMLMEQSQCIAGVIQLHCVHTEGISEAMRVNTSYPAGFGVH